jgi:hypothetical protein
MTRNGKQYRFRVVSCRVHVPWRGTLYVGRTRRRVRVHRLNGAVRHCVHGHAAYGAGAPASQGFSGRTYVDQHSYGTCLRHRRWCRSERARRVMSGERLPELLRGLGIEPFLDDATTLQRLADVALDLARRAANSRDAEGCRRELELFEWCSERLSRLQSDVFQNAAAASPLVH